MSNAVSRIATRSASPTTPPIRQRQRPPVAPTRLLGPHHFAYYRGYLQGLDLGRLAARYLTPGLDLRQARTTLGWIEGELVRGVKRLATRSRHDGEATLLTEKHWLALITPPAGEAATARQARRRKLLRALDALQPLLLTRPAPGDAVAGWFAPPIASKLAAAGWLTLAALQAAIAGDARSWYRHAHGIGAATAQHIETWLREQSMATGVAGATFQRATGIAALAPLESLQHAAAQADAETIRVWLQGYRPEGSRSESSHTWRAYRTQAERFLLWTVFARGKALAALTAEDCAAYLDFLADPQPAAQWVGPRGTPRDRHDWRPFEGPLSPSSIRHATRILKTLCAWLVEHRHLAANPFLTMAQPAGRSSPRTPRIQVDRSFSRAQWQYLKTFVATLPPDDPRTARLQFMLRLVYATGLRISEQAQATVGDLAPVSGDDHPHGWTLTVPGARTRTMALPETVVDALRAHMEARGLGRDVERLPARTPLIGRIQPGDADAPLSVTQVAAIWKRCFTRAGQALEGDDASGALHFAQASAHWLRHTAGAHAIARGVARKAVQQQLGHASVTTTAGYASVEAN